ncbi:unnamed protein product [Trichobilharzia regenti]|nr:unnamed protein product [Trichobilharzia regenti]
MTPKFAQEKRVTVSESSSDSTSLRGITTQSKELENCEVDQRDYGKPNICDDGHDEMRRMPTTADLNKGSIQLEREVDLRAGAVAEGMNTSETVSVNDQRVFPLSTDVKVKLKLIVKDSSGSDLAVRQTSQGRTVTASEASQSSSTGINQSSLVLSSTLKVTSMKSYVLCCDYASIRPFERTNVNGHFSVDKPTVYEGVIVKLTCTNKGISSFKLLFEYYNLWRKLFCAYAGLYNKIWKDTQEKLSDILALEPDPETQKPEKVLSIGQCITFIYLLKSEEVQMTLDQAIRLIQRHERARQGRIRAKFMREIRQQEEVEKSKGEDRKTYTQEEAAIIFQKVCVFYKQLLDELYFHFSLFKKVSLI